MKINYPFLSKEKQPWGARTPPTRTPTHQLVMVAIINFVSILCRAILPVGAKAYTVKNGVLWYTFAMVFWDTFTYVGVT